MRRLPAVPTLSLVFVSGTLALLLPACSDLPEEPAGVPQLAGAPSPPPGLEAALRAHARHSGRLLATAGVVGTAVGLNPAGRAVLKVYTDRPGLAAVPRSLDQVPVEAEVTGRIYALTDPTARFRPAPIGVSVGHPSITAGTIGARVIDPSGKVYVLSNNHVLAAANSAQINDPALQPGPVDGGTNPADRIGTLSAYEPLQLGFNCYGCTYPPNYIDAAIALSTTAELGNATPADDGYGAPNSSLYGDGNGDGALDDRGLLLGIGVQKYGRTTRLTQGQVTEINVTINVCYDIFCLTIGRFLDQVGICCSGFSGGGDSGSLIVSADGDRKPVALLFAGGGDRTFANRIDLVLNRFGVEVDGGSAPPPGVSDIAVTAVSAPGSATIGSQVTVGASVESVGDLAVTHDITVTLRDETAGTVIGTQTIPGGLGAGGSTVLDFNWNTSGQSVGSHTLSATQSPADANPANDSRTAAVTLSQPASGTMHVGDLDGGATSQGRTWTATVTIAVHDAAHLAVPAATVKGTFSNGAKGTGSCITGSTGICTISKTRLRSAEVTFTVTSVTHATNGYAPGANHDGDGDSGGTTIVVTGP